MGQQPSGQSSLDPEIKTTKEGEKHVYQNKKLIYAITQLPRSYLETITKYLVRPATVSRDYRFYEFNSTGRRRYDLTRNQVDTSHEIVNSIIIFLHDRNSLTSYVRFQAINSLNNQGYFTFYKYQQSLTGGYLCGPYQNTEPDQTCPKKVEYLRKSPKVTKLTDSGRKKAVFIDTQIPLLNGFIGIIGGDYSLPYSHFDQENQTLIVIGTVYGRIVVRTIAEEETDKVYLDFETNEYGLLVGPFFRTPLIPFHETPQKGEYRVVVNGELYYVSYYDPTGTGRLITQQQYYDYQAQSTASLKATLSKDPADIIEGYLKR